MECVMRARLLTVVAAAVLVAAGLAAPAAAAPPADHAAALRLARQPLAPNDGWAAAGAGTTGGAAADDAHVVVVHDRAGLIAAVAGDVPKIVLVSGRIDMNAGSSCAGYADPEYDLDAFLAAYDPAVWGRAVKPSGPLEDARVRSTRRQGEQIRVNVGSNTTIVGLRGSGIDGGNLLLTNVSNVIVRGLNLTDHNSFSDGDNPDSAQPLYFGRPYQVHDGASDIIRGSDLVTVSYNDYHHHDKTMLIGSTDTPGVDVGKLRVTLHHNRFADVLQRAPRVRFGQVDVYNNLFIATDERYSYSLGVGVESSIYAQNNFFVTGGDVATADIIHYWKGTRITATGSLLSTGGPPRPVDLVAAYNAAYDPDLSPDAGWTPTLRRRLDPAVAVPLVVSVCAGARPLAR
jgi:pectate lyase